MVLNYFATNYIGWPLPALISMLQRYKKYLDYARFYTIILYK